MGSITGTYRINNIDVKSGGNFTGAVITFDGQYDRDSLGVIVQVGLCDRVGKPYFKLCNKCIYYVNSYRMFKQQTKYILNYNVCTV